MSSRCSTWLLAGQGSPSLRKTSGQESTATIAAQARRSSLTAVGRTNGCPEDLRRLLAKLVQWLGGWVLQSAVLNVALEQPGWQSGGP